MKKILIISSLSLLATNVLAACPSGTTADPQSGICTRSGCGGKCTYELTLAQNPNPNNEYNISVKPNKGAEGDVVLGEFWRSYGELPVHDFIVGEGMTGMSGYSIINAGSGTLKLPSTLKNMGGFATYNVGFKTIDLSDVKNLETSIGWYNTLQNSITLNGVFNLQNLIVSEDTSPISIGGAYSGSYPSGEIKIQCKGTNLEKCQNLLKTRLSGVSLSPAYYQGYDESGHLTEEWGPNGCTKYSYDAGGNLQRQTDENGNVLWARRIYTVEEAAKVTNGKNSFSIRYR